MYRQLLLSPPLRDLISTARLYLGACPMVVDMSSVPKAELAKGYREGVGGGLRLRKDKSPLATQKQ